MANDFSAPLIETLMFVPRGHAAVSLVYSRSLSSSQGRLTDILHECGEDQPGDGDDGPVPRHNE